MARPRGELGGLGGVARRLSRGALVQLPAHEVQRGLEPQPGPGLEPVDEVLEAGPVGALEVMGDLTAVAGRHDATLGDPH